MAERVLPITGPPARAHMKLVRELLETCAEPIADFQTRLHDHPGVPAQLTFEGLIAGCVLTSIRGANMWLTNITATLLGLPSRERKKYGVEVSGKTVTYRQVTHLYERATKMLAQGQSRAVNDFDLFATKLLSEQVNACGIEFTRDVALDGTIVQTRAQTRWRPKSDGTGHEAWSKDPDATHGYYPKHKENSPGLAVGYEALLFSPVPVTAETKQPQLACALAFQPNHTGHRPKARHLAQHTMLGKYDALIHDGGFHFAENDWKFSDLGELGLPRLFDPHKTSRQQNAFEGALLHDGDSFCPGMPEQLQSISNPAKSENTDSPTARKSGVSPDNHEALYDERESFRFVRKSNTEKYFQGICPARKMKVRCPLYAPSMALGYEFPTVTPPTEPPKCCTNKVLNVPVELLTKNRQALPYGTKRWRKRYRKGRSHIENVNAGFRGNIESLPEKIWTRVMGRAQTGFMFLMKLLATNGETIRRHRAGQAIS